MLNRKIHHNRCKEYMLVEKYFLYFFLNVIILILIFRLIFYRIGINIFIITLHCQSYQYCLLS
jgi:hypothetical protein